jgi:hypothetical protein
MGDDGVSGGFMVVAVTMSTPEVLGVAVPVTVLSSVSTAAVGRTFLATSFLDAPPQVPLLAVAM